MLLCLVFCFSKVEARFLSCRGDALAYVVTRLFVGAFISSCHPERREACTPPAVEPAGRCDSLSHRDLQRISLTRPRSCSASLAPLRGSATLKMTRAGGNRQHRPTIIHIVTNKLLCLVLCFGKDRARQLISY